MASRYKTWVTRLGALAGAIVVAVVGYRVAFDRSGNVSRRMDNVGIIGGIAATDSEFPYLAFVQYDGPPVGHCTGVVVAPRLILTAAHCVVNLKDDRDQSPVKYTVLTGNLDRRSPRRQVSGVENIMVFPRFEPQSGHGDAALLMLSKPTTVHPVTLETETASKSSEPGTVVKIAGWGEPRYEPGGPVRKLVQGETVVQPAIWCVSRVAFFDSADQVCAIDAPSYRTAACFGDSGGPLLTRRRLDMSVLDIGVVSSGQDDCSDRHPTMFTRVAAIFPWVHGWIARLDAVAPP
jgi:secreted trypsin-like serine protease